MAHPSRKLPRIAVLLAVSLAAGALWAARRLPKPDDARLVPGLQSARIVGWLDGRRVIARPYGSHQELVGLDLETSAKLNVTGLIPDSFPWPFPSPDGHWLLTVEWKEHHPTPIRFALTSTQNGTTRYIPSSGRFEPGAGYPIARVG